MKNFKALLPVLAIVLTMLIGSVVSGYCQDASGVVVAMPIVMAYTLAAITKPTAPDNNGGTKKYFYLSDVTHITTFQPVMVWAAAGDEVRTTATHVWAANKAAAKIYITEDTGEVTAESIGSRDGRSKKVTFKAFHPGTYAEFAEAERNWKAMDGIVHVPLANGKMLQMGAPGEECEIICSWKSNKRSGDGAGFEIEVSCFANSLMFYEGTIDTDFTT